MISAAFKSAQLFEKKAQTNPSWQHFQVGDFAVSAQSILPDAAEDLAYLYRMCRVDESALTDNRIKVCATTDRTSLPFRKRYTIHGDDQVLFTRRTANEVLPYLEWAINWRIIATQNQFLQLHAGTVSKQGNGLVFAASSGSGKTTLTAAMLARGWDYHSDEFALINPNTLHLHPFPKAMCIKAGSFNILEELGLPLWRRRHYAKAFKGQVAYLCPADIRRDIISKPTPVKMIVFPRYVAAATPRMTQLPRAQAALELAEMSFNRQTFSAKAVAVLSEIVRNAKCYRLESGHLEATCQTIEKYFDRALADSSSLP